ncbi:MAG TPA: hypothetical protein VHU84_08250 [Lacipirellulaceae bacterium]|nr:hypothetical protein [Lacipirellulaceae bacterium]
MGKWNATDWIGVYTAITATVAIVWHSVNWRRSRRVANRVTLRIKQGSMKPENGPFVRWLNLYVRNCSPNHAFIERLEVRRQRGAAGPLAIRRSDKFPCGIGPFREVKIERLDLAIFHDHPEALVVVDDMNRKWRLAGKELQSAIVAAAEIQQEYDVLGLTDEEIERRIRAKDWRGLPSESLRSLK